ncbi:hypothetical protein [Streptomyces sp. NP-1717]|uniref:hypothetical protein n=1 Tax=Streptomyces sp. NP-1717 TaxID=2704470 RepID=UPI001F5C4799|nr:hypothetical protein [Streptomyces sp. NP-1717]
MHRAMTVVFAAAMAVVMGAGSGSGVEAPGAGEGGVGAVGQGPERGPVEADVAHHGHVSLWGGRLTVRLSTGNHGPSDLAGATAGLVFSEPLAAGQKLPAGCLWGGDRVVYCQADALRADGRDSEFLLDLRTAGDPAELSVDIATVWNGGAEDRNPDNDKHHVLVPATGDLYIY